MSHPPSPTPLASDPTPKDAPSKSPAPSEPTSKGLKAGSIGIGPTVALGLAAVAPAYSLAVTLGFVVLAVGASTPPAAFLLGFVPPILFTALAFRDLNKEMPDCGGVFVWITRVFGPTAGWFLGGWVPQVATFIASAALAQVATTYLLNFFGLAGSPRNQSP